MSNWFGWRDLLLLAFSSRVSRFLVPLLLLPVAIVCWLFFILYSGCTWIIVTWFSLFESFSMRFSICYLMRPPSSANYPPPSWLLFRTGCFFICTRVESVLCAYLQKTQGRLVSHIDQSISGSENSPLISEQGRKQMYAHGNGHLF